MRIQRGAKRRGEQAGFTLAEAAVTIALVAVTLTVLLQSLEGSKMLAAHTRDQKIAKELALAHLAEIEAGLWQEELDFSRSGSYADQGHGTFWWELAIGDETFTDDDDRDDFERPFDTWAHREEVRRDQEAESDEEDDEATEPFEKIRIRVTFPKYQDFSNDIEYERWVPWEQVYGEEEEEENAGGGPADGGADQGGDGGEG